MKPLRGGMPQVSDTLVLVFHFVDIKAKQHLDHRSPTRHLEQNTCRSPSSLQEKVGTPLAALPGHVPHGRVSQKLRSLGWFLHQWVSSVL